MSTDYVLFIHGVKTLSREEFETQANAFLKAIKNSLRDDSRNVKPIFCFWGDINIIVEIIVEFVGDAALYLSRHIGAQVLRRLKICAVDVLKDADVCDRFSSNPNKLR